MRPVRIAETRLNKVPVEFVEPDSPDEHTPSVDFTVGNNIVAKGLTLDDLLGLRIAISKAESVLRYRKELAMKGKNHILDF